jgi:aromatic ring-opening dioxygenase catalytic subunit (LigB family)
MLVSHALLVPHLPTLVLDQHRGHHTPMLEALAHASERLLSESPLVIVALSARWSTPGPFRVDAGRRHRTITDYPGLGVEVRYDCPGHPLLARVLVEAGEKRRLPAASAVRGVDSGVSVPLHFLVPRAHLPVVPLSMPARPPAECRAWGDALRHALAAWPERVAFVVGGALSLNLHAWSLRREVPEAAALDAWALDVLGRGAWDDLQSARPGRLVEHAQPEASLLHLEVMRGFLGEDRAGLVRCYESGPGVGAALVEFPIEAGAEATQGA